MSRASKTIGIRLPPDLQDLLREEAAKRGMKPTSYAQKLVADALTRSDTPVEERLSELRSAIDRIERELPAQLRAAVAGAAISGGGSPPGLPVTLRDWVTQTEGDD